jgi:cob(I)alamin adenosyltransferase
LRGADCLSEEADAGAEMKLENGKVQVYTGNGKGKTTAALGLALRAAGREMRICIIQFLKGGECGEHLAAAKLSPYVTIIQAGREGCIGKGSVCPEDHELAAKGLALAARAVSGEEYDVVILDEVNNSVHLGLLRVEDVLMLINNKGSDVELILTGRNADARVMEAADLVTEMREIKHYYKAGVKARIGIEK